VLFSRLPPFRVKLKAVKPRKQKEKFLANFVPDPNGLPEMFPSVDVWWSVVFGAIGGVITVLLVKMWENNRAPNLTANRGRNLPQEHDERLG